MAQADDTRRGQASRGTNWDSCSALLQLLRIQQHIATLVQSCYSQAAAGVGLDNCTLGKSTANHVVDRCYHWGKTSWWSCLCREVCNEFDMIHPQVHQRNLSSQTCMCPPVMTYKEQAEYSPIRPARAPCSWYRVRKLQSQCQCTPGRTSSRPRWARSPLERAADMGMSSCTGAPAPEPHKSDLHYPLDKKRWWSCPRRAPGNAHCTMYLATNWGSTRMR